MDTIKKSSQVGFLCLGRSRPNGSWLLGGIRRLASQHDEGGDAERRGDEGEHATAGGYAVNVVAGGVESAPQEQCECDHRQHPARTHHELLFHAKLH